MSKHCATCTCPAAGYCHATADRGHETFECLEPAGHPGPHLGGAYHDPCPGCDGLDHHADGCSTPEWMEDPSTPFLETVWDDDDGIVRRAPIAAPWIEPVPGLRLHLSAVRSGRPSQVTEGIDY